ncbi:hypothetical protein GCM10010269_59200 [Streptomyces humidus]|uniref:Uncharacterized protein n=1 Tax=Streptomyces humidus TaxID=52259 RepID=A0A918G1R9_9ACTN|nr:hypothetical protein GCM10010269_59200 [Streptomyces humidus]
MPAAPASDDAAPPEGEWPEGEWPPGRPPVRPVAGGAGSDALPEPAEHPVTVRANRQATPAVGSSEPLIASAPTLVTSLSAGNDARFRKGNLPHADGSRGNCGHTVGSWTQARKT